MMFSIFPFPHGLLIKDDSMRKWSKEHKNYIQLQVTVKEFGGQGACSLLHAFLTNLFLSNLSDSLNIKRPVRKKQIHTLFSYMYTSKFIRHPHQAKCLAFQNCEVKEQERIPESCTFEQ